MKITEDANNHSRASKTRSTTMTTTTKAKSNFSPNLLTMAAARDYVVMGQQEMETIVASVNTLLKSSREVLHRGLVSHQAVRASDWLSATTAETPLFPVKQYPLLDSSSGATPNSKDSQKKPMEDDRDDTTTGRTEENGNNNNNNNNRRGELNGIMDSMGHVFTVVEGYQKQAQQVAKDLIDSHEQYRQQEAAAEDLSRRVDWVTTSHKAFEARESPPPLGAWNLQDTDRDEPSSHGGCNSFLFGSLLPSVSKYPEGSEPLFSVSSSSPSTDAFLPSLASFLGNTSTKDDNARSSTTRSKQRTRMKKEYNLESQIKYLNSVQHVSKTCERQVEELDTILTMGSILSETEDTKNTSSKKKHSNKKSSAIIHPPYHGESEVVEYIQEARTKLIEYGALAEGLLQDQIKYLVTQYTTAILDGKDQIDNRNCDSDEEATDYAAEFEQLRTIFNSRTYDIDVMEYMRAQSNHELEEKLLHTLHESVFLRNIGDQCDQEIRVHVGREVSVTVCNIVMSSLTGGGEPHRISECGARLLSNHVRTLHAYVVAFCNCSLPALGREKLLRKVKRSASELNNGASPMDANWKRLFSVLDILKIKQLSQYDQSTMLHPLYTTEDARRILSLRTDFDEQDIDNILKTANRGRTKVRAPRTVRRGLFENERG